MTPVHHTSAGFPPSKFYMWRCIIAMAHADGIVMPEERAYLTGLFENMKARAGLSAEQHRVFLKDIERPQDAGDMLRHINEPKYRAQVIYFARLLAYKDGELHPNEEDLLERLRAAVLEGVDLDAIRLQVRENVAKEMTLHDIQIDKNRPTTMLSKLVDDFLLVFGYDMLRD